MCHRQEELKAVFAFIVGLQYLTEAMPVLSTTPKYDQDEVRLNKYHTHRWRGEQVKIQCDARMAGFELSKVKVVWALHLQRMSDSGCNPKDPVMTLVKLKHVNSHSEADQIYSTIKGVPGWTVHAEGARLDPDLTNAQTAWVGVYIDQAKPEDSGTYRCDALIGDIDSSLPMQFMTSYTTVTVSGPHKSVPDFSHVTMEESVASKDYDSTMIGPLQNHRRVGQSVNISCAPRLLRQLPTLPFPVSLVHIRFLPFRRPGIYFFTVAQYFPDDDLFISNPPEDRMWEFSHDGINPELDRAIDSLYLRINIGIINATLEDTGIFDCAVTEATTGNTYHAEAGLKVSGNARLQAGYCDPLRPEEDGLFHFEENEASSEDDPEDPSLDLDVGAIEDNFSEKPPNKDSSKACLAAVAMMILSLLILLYLARKHICAPCGLGEEPPKKMSKQPSPEPMPILKEERREEKPEEKKVKKKKKKKDEKDKKKKKKKKKEAEKHVTIQLENPDDEVFSPFTSYHFDYLRDWLYEEPCIPLTNTNIQKI